MYSCWCFEVVGVLKTPTTVHTADHSEDKPEDGSVCEPKHVARNTTK